MTNGDVANTFSRVIQEDQEAMLPLFHKLLRQEDLHAQEPPQEQIDWLNSSPYAGWDRGSDIERFDVLKHLIADLHRT